MVKRCLHWVTLTWESQESQSETTEASWVQRISFPSRATSRRQSQRRTSLGRFAELSMRRWAPTAPFEAREVTALALTNEATRLFLQSDLMAIADRHGEQVAVDGVVYQRHEPGTVRYFTLCGPLDIARWTYRAIGVRNGPTIVPLELDAGLVGGGVRAGSGTWCCGCDAASHSTRARVQAGWRSLGWRRGRRGRWPVSNLG